MVKIPEINQINKIFNFVNSIITISLVIYLFITIIAATHLINISEGPIRVKIYVQTYAKNPPII